MAQVTSIGYSDILQGMPWKLLFLTYRKTLAGCRYGLFFGEPEPFRGVLLGVPFLDLFFMSIKVICFIFLPFKKKILIMKTIELIKHDYLNHSIFSKASDTLQIISCLISICMQLCCTQRWLLCIIAWLQNIVCTSR